MSNSIYTEKDLVNPCPDGQPYFNKTTSNYGFDKKNYALSSKLFFNNWDVKDWGEFYGHQSGEDRLAYRLDKCHDWDSVIKYAHPDFKHWTLADLDTPGVYTEKTTEICVRMLRDCLEHSRLNATIAGMLPLDVKEMKQWEERFDITEKVGKGWTYGFLQARENAELESPISFSSAEDFLPMTRSLESLDERIKVLDIELAPGEYLQDGIERLDLLPTIRNARLVFVRSGKGTGKTVMASKSFPGSKRAVSSKRTLSTAVANTYDIPSHIRLTAEQQAKAVSLSTCYPSLIHTRASREPYTFIVDEVVQGMETMVYGGVGMKSTRSNVLNSFMANMLHSRQALFMDADLTPEIANMMTYIYEDLLTDYEDELDTDDHYNINRDGGVVFLDVRKEQKALPIRLITNAAGGVLYKDYVMKRVKEGKNIVVWIENKRILGELHRELQMMGIKVESITSETQDTPFMEAFSEFPMKAIQDFSVQVILHTSSMDTGVSLDDPDYFDEHILFQNIVRGGCTAQMVSQIAGRIRNLMTPRTIFIRPWSKTLGISEEWTANPHGLAAKTFVLAAKEGWLSDSEMFKFNFKTGENVFNPDTRKSQLMITAMNYQARQNMDINYTLREQLTWDGYGIDEMTLDELMAGLKGVKSGTKKKLKKRMAAVIEIGPVTETPLREDFEDSEQGAEEYETTKARWYCERLWPDQFKSNLKEHEEKVRDECVMYYLSGGYASDKAARERREVFRNLPDERDVEALKELSLSWVEDDRKKAGLTQMMYHSKPAYDILFAALDANGAVNDKEWFSIVNYKIFGRLDEINPVAKDVWRIRKANGEQISAPEIMERLFAINIHYGGKNGKRLEIHPKFLPETL